MITFRGLFTLGLIYILTLHLSSAKEGMWLPLLLERLNIEDMQENGLRLSAEDIYSVNQACLIDAVVLFGGGCTGELISDKGLLITNHHCGLSRIQLHSTVEKDYLTDGFWAMNRSQELPNPGLEVTFLRRMEDITQKVLQGVTIETDEPERYRIVTENMDKIRADAIDGTNYEAEIKPFYYGNQYFLFVYEVYKDVRLVGAPPSSIGKFGWDTDNWIWPRHTGDFSLFRIYSDENNNPADYSPDNIPYKPRKYLPISLKGIQENDFTMVIGYPGSTYQFLTSCDLRNIVHTSVPSKIKVRTIRMNIMQEEMMKSNEVMIKYASKYSRVTNSWKKWIGMLNGLEKVGALNKKYAFEKTFNEWVNSDEERKRKYGNILDEIELVCDEIDSIILANDYYSEIVMAIEFFDVASELRELVEEYEDETVSPDDFQKSLNSFRNFTGGFYNNYHEPIDRRVFARLMEVYAQDLSVDFQPEIFQKVNTKFNRDFGLFSDWLLQKTILTDEQEMKQLVEEFDKKSVKRIKKDPGYVLFSQFDDLLQEVRFAYAQLEYLLDFYYRIYINGIMEMYPDRVFYPDANLTMRVTYGRIEDYSPRDAVIYDFYTTLGGVMEKEREGVYDYIVPDRLKELYQLKDYGSYGTGGEMPVCFIASNHTSGGNSGSPVLNADGQLIGINFDRNWEGTMSDYMYDPDQCRNIILDVRYVLFIIDKLAGAGYLIDEMTLVY
ncbi:MAG: peptidase S46 [Bacteroides sp. SM23_62_1]|nr:MAG: peptidase S46 [Bacteroides sp. SM23_62_1]